VSDPQPLPVERIDPFDPPPALVQRQRRSPISRLAYPDGTAGWLVTTHATTRAVLADPRFSARQELKRMPVASGMVEQERRPADPGMFISMDAPEHTRYRKVFAAAFGARRMRMLTPRVERIVERALDRMIDAGEPADLVADFALPVPSLTICELLGVPKSERDHFQRDAATAHTLESTPEQVGAAFGAVSRLLSELVAHKRDFPGDDLLSAVAAAGTLRNDELVGAAVLLLFAGHETTANMIALGTFALLCHPDQWAALVANPALVHGAVEELLRYLSIVHLGLVRAALEDVEIDGVTVRAGEVVTCALPVVNRDPRRFADPDRLDIRRDPGGHLGFGAGVHQCIGAQLARIEMRAAFAALARRLPRLRIAIEPNEVPMRHDMAFYGVHRLPVGWGAVSSR